MCVGGTVIVCVCVWGGDTVIVCVWCVGGGEVIVCVCGWGCSHSVCVCVGGTQS